MHVNITAFGQLADITGSNIQLEDIEDTNELMALLITTYPALKNISFVIAVDKKIISNNTVVSAASSIALLPPFSGG